MRRRLAAIEQMMWRGALEKPANFTLTAHIKGHLSSDQLRAALHRLVGRHAHLRLRVEIDEYDRILFNTEDVAEFDIRQAERHTPNDWITKVERELRTPFNWRTGALVRFVLLHDAVYTDLIITAHHCALDGLSLAYLLRDILSAVANPTAPIERLPEFAGIDHLMPSSVIENMPHPESTYSRPLVVKGKNRRALFEAVNMQAIIDQHITIVAWSMNQAETQALLERCKFETVGVHSVICAAWMLAFGQVYGNPAPYWRRVSNPVSLRRWFSRDVGESLGMFVTPQLIIGADCSPERSIWNIARDLMSALKNTATESALFAPHLALRDVLKTIDDDTTPENDVDFDVAYDLAVTNIGVLNFPRQYGDLELQAIYAPTVNGYGTEKILGICNFGGQLFFNYIVAADVQNHAEVERLRDVAMGILQEAVQITFY